MGYRPPSLQIEDDSLNPFGPNFSSCWAVNISALLPITQLATGSSSVFTESSRQPSEYTRFHCTGQNCFHWSYLAFALPSRLICSAVWQNLCTAQPCDYLESSFSTTPPMLLRNHTHYSPDSRRQCESSERFQCVNSLSATLTSARI